MVTKRDTEVPLPFRNTCKQCNRNWPDHEQSDLCFCCKNQREVTQTCARCKCQFKYMAPGWGKWGWRGRVYKKAESRYYLYCQNCLEARAKPQTVPDIQTRAEPGEVDPSWENSVRQLEDTLSTVDEC